MDSVEHYSAILRTAEADTLVILSRIRDQSFNRLIRRSTTSPRPAVLRRRGGALA